MEVKNSESLAKALMDRVCAIPNGKNIKGCIQCGTCSASCPSSDAMEYSPREILAALRAGILERVFQSRTIWLCASCYLCTVRCPARIPFADVMYELKVLGVENNLYKYDKKNVRMSREFSKVIERYGRNAEMELVLNYYLKTNPFILIEQMPFAMRMFFRGRLGIFQKKIKGIKGLRKMLAMMEESANE